MVRHGRQSAEAISCPSWETANPSLLREIPRSFSSSFVPTEICSSVSVAGPPSRDDMLIMSRTQAEAAANLSTVMTFLIGLGFIINLKKSVMTPTQQLEFLGFPPVRQTVRVEKAVGEDLEPWEDNGTGAFPTIGDDGGSSPGNSTSSVILPTLGGHKDQDAPNGGIIQLRDTRTHTQDGRGTHLVDFQGKWVQWSTSTSREMGVDDPPSSHVSHLRQTFRSKGLSEGVIEILKRSWRTSTQSGYSSAWGQWDSWCTQRSIDPLSAPISSILEFLFSQYNM